MGLFDHFPYTNVHELNLDWILSMMKSLEAAWNDFTAGNSLTFADPLLHDMTKTYAKNTIVLDSNGNAYVSLEAVPVGVALSNQNYWLMVFDYEAFIEKVNKNFTARYYRDQYRATAPIAIGDWLTVDDVLCKATAAIAVDDILEVGVNIEHFTLEDFIKAFMQSATQLIQQYKQDIDASELQYKNELSQDFSDTVAALQAELDQAISGVTVDSEVINARVALNNFAYPTLRNAIWYGQNQMFKAFDGLANAIKLLPYWYGKGNFDGSGNFVAGSPYYDCSDYLPLPDNCPSIKLITSYNNGVLDGGILLNFYDADKNPIGTNGAWDKEYIIDNHDHSIRYIRIRLALSDGGALSTVNYIDYLDIWAYTDTDCRDIKHDITWSRGDPAPGGAVNPNPTGFTVSPLIYIGDIDFIDIELESGYGIYYTGYDENRNFLGALNSSFENPCIIKNHAATYIRLFMGTTGGVGADVTIKLKKMLAHKLPIYGKEPYYANLTYGRQFFTVKNSSGDDIDCMFMPSKDYTATGKPSKLLMVCHGSGYKVDAANDQYGANNVNNINMLKYFNEHGYSLFDVNGYDMDPTYGKEMWGCREGAEVYRKAYEYLVRNYNVESNFSIYAYSMGGLSAMTILSSGMTNINCVILAAPVASLYTECWVNEEVTSRATVARAYGFTGSNISDYDQDKARPSDPFDNIFSIGGNDVYLKPVPPIRCWHGDADTVPYSYPQNLIASMKNANDQAEFILLSGYNHDFCWGGVPAMYPNFVAYLDRFNN